MVDLSVVIASAGGAFAGGGLGAGASLVVAQLREKGARREEWYRRFQHVAGLVLSARSEEREVGLALLRVLLNDPLAGTTERRLGETLYAVVLGGGALGDVLDHDNLDDQDLLAAGKDESARRKPLALEDDEDGNGHDGPAPEQPGGGGG